MIRKLALTCLLFSPGGFAQEPPLENIAFTAASEDFPNPERGFYKYRTLTSPGGFNIRSENKTLIYGGIPAADFRAQPLSADFLSRIQAGFDTARSNGIKVNPRVMYSGAIGDPDAPLSVVLGHIGQLKPLWEKNRDVINVLDPGFIGAWGEWHSSSNGLDSKENRKIILDALLAALPADRMLLVRQPRFKREYLTGDPGSSAAVLAAARAFDASALARIGHLNDCFLSSPNDQGTYTNWILDQELDYLESEGRFAPWGGETCALHERNDCGNALSEMARLHVDYLNNDFHPDVLQKWKTQGCYEEIARRIGYRLAFAGARLPRSVKPGGILLVEFTVKNEGFGELFNPRPVELVLTPSGGTEKAAVIPLDPRRWSGGQTATVKAGFAIPANQGEGAYSLGVRLPDSSASLRKDARYAVRFANAGVWNAASGVNILLADFRIDKSAPGAVNPAFVRFEVLPAGSVAIQPGCSGKGPCRLGAALAGTSRRAVGSSVDGRGRRMRTAGSVVLFPN